MGKRFFTERGTVSAAGGWFARSRWNIRRRSFYRTISDIVDAVEATKNPRLAYATAQYGCGDFAGRRAGRAGFSVSAASKRPTDATWPVALTAAHRRASPNFSDQGGRRVRLAVLCWLQRDRLVERLETEVNDLADDSQALDDAERGFREADLTARILQTERVEESFIEQADLAGQTIARRPDPDPRSVLGRADSVTSREV